MPPGVPYIVCATPRSGSTLLCRALTATGVAGYPEEYFEARAATGRPPAPRDYFADAAGVDLDELLGGDQPLPPAPEYSSLAGIKSYDEHVSRTLERGSTPNGVFGAKIMWGHLDDLAQLAGDRPPKVFDRLFGQPRYVWVSRRDRIRQAVSLWKAIQTQAWAADSPQDHPARYSFVAIDHLRQLLAAHDRAWMSFFDVHHIEPLALTYEQIAADLPGAVRAVLEHLGLDPAAADGVEAPLERQADSLSEEWVQTYDRESSEVTV